MKLQELKGEINPDEKYIIDNEAYYHTVNDVIKYVEKQIEKRILRKCFTYILIGTVILTVTVLTLIRLS